MNYSKIDLASNYERNQDILNGYNLETLLLEIHCNLKDNELTAEGITKQFNESLAMNINSAKEIFKDNLESIIEQAKKERNQ